MVLTSSEQEVILDMCKKIAPRADDLGGEAFDRLFLSFPQTKIYFSHFDLTPGSDDIRAHGGKVMKALHNAAKHLDDLPRKLSSLNDLHAQKLRVDPGQFRLLSRCIQEVLDYHFPNDFTAKVQATWEKFLVEVSGVLTAQHS
ncbi:PREDICTED: hemoglobin larval subunit alpha-like [Nanorana parkeri]|uniref:hemoglobin larval subunit alpha-like n=1 Tax=Nanorana parkeri TaxID=125878 RepID=UPI000854236A|nr:PREDICTED: hemoglobin larval subunit alpha-like [Nanorana parkeri]